MASTLGRRYLHASRWYILLVQAGGGVLLGVLLPFAIASMFNPRLTHEAVFLPSGIACLAAVLGGAYLFVSLVSYPGIRATYYIVPTFSSTFAVVFILLLLLRLDYSRPLLVVSYMVSVAWYYLVHFTIQRQPGMSIGVVPLGDVAPLLSIPRIQWDVLSSPDPQRNRYTAVVADFRADLPDAWESFLADTALNGTPVLHVKHLRESLTGRVEIELSENAHGTLVPDSAYRTAKLVFDVIMAAIALVVLSPLFLIVGLLIRLDSPGPVFFRQRRIGYRGQPFEVWKFRTMAHRADRGSSSREEAMTQENDVRVTRIGRFLRRSRIDELPQLLNVARGQMSLIGPRPEAEILSAWYQTEIPFYRYRHIVRPGITGWAQVNQGHVSEVADVHSKLHYDFYYISNYSLWIDILIMARTIRTMATGFGSK